MNSETMNDETGNPQPLSLDELPVLTQVVEVHEDLPTLTEVVEPAPAESGLELALVSETGPESEPEVEPAPLPRLSDEEFRQLLKLLEARLEVVFTQKLSLHLEKLQHLAVKQAVNEFRAALPELMREILYPPSDPKQ